MKLFLKLVQFCHRIPKWKCRRCARYRGYCPLQDLEPCSFVRKPKTEDK